MDVYGSLLYSEKSAFWYYGEGIITYCGYNYNSNGSSYTGNLYIKYNPSSSSSVCYRTRTIPILSYNSTASSYNKLKTSGFSFVKIDGDFLNFDARDIIELKLFIKMEDSSGIYGTNIGYIDIGNDSMSVLYLEDTSKVSLINCTLANNTSNTGRAIVMMGYDCELDIVNTILFGDEDQSVWMHPPLVTYLPHTLNISNSCIISFFII